MGLTHHIIIFYLVHFRKKLVTKDIIPSPPTSPNTFWQIEKSTDSISGKTKYIHVNEKIMNYLCS